MAQWGGSTTTFTDEMGNRRFPREQEGFGRALNVAEGEVPRCSSIFSALPANLADFRGVVPGSTTAFRERTAITWETSPAESAETTVFTWIGGSQLYPSMRPAYPFVAATLSVNGVPRLQFSLGCAEIYTATGDGFTLWFEPRRLLSLVEDGDRSFAPHGVSGFYRLQAPGEMLTAGEPLQITVELPPAQQDYVCSYYISPRTDALQISLATHRDEIAQLQADVVQLKRSHEMLYAQVYPELFPNRVQGERSILHMSETRHMHPPCLTTMRNGEIVLTFRDGATHLDVNGRMLLKRSHDNGRTWNAPQVLFDLPRADHRCAPIVELPNGDWVTLDYRAGGEYNEDDTYWMGDVHDAPTLWSAWSTDRGAHWSFGDEPLVNPQVPNRYAEAERHMIRLPNGRLLAAANFFSPNPDTNRNVQIAIYASDDNARHWSYLASLPAFPHLVGEPTLLRGAKGRIVVLARTVAADIRCSGMLVQYNSEDDGQTWSDPIPTAMSSLSTPAHLIQLQDGRFLCTHASRGYPASIYVTVSEDQGATWNTANTKVITNDIVSEDSTYPTTCQLADGTLLTAWYGSLFGKFYIAGLRYAPGELG